jgi:hypothetical protein
VEPAPEIVAEPPLDELLDELELELLDELELLLPHAARPSASTATLASAPILFLITTSPLLDYVSVVARQPSEVSPDRSQQSLLIARRVNVNIS